MTNSPIGDGTTVFWPQAYNSSVKQWYAYPVNMERVAHGADDVLNFIHKVLDGLELEKLWNETFATFQKIM